MIDFHTHLHPARLFSAIRRWFAERSSWDLSGQPHEPEEVAAALRAAGVERFVFFSYAHKTGIAPDLNAWLVATAHRLGGAGIPLATVHLDDPDPLGDVVRALDEGCAGLKIHEDVQRLAVDDPRFEPIFEEVSRRGVVVAHVGPTPWREEPAAGAARVARVLEKHPNLQFVVAHMGAPDTALYYEMMSRFSGLHLDTTMLFAADSPVARRGAGDVFAREALEAHATRIVYGTDFPNIPYPYELERKGLEALGLRPASLDAILSANARRLLLRAGYDLSAENAAGS